MFLRAGVSLSRGLLRVAAPRGGAGGGVGLGARALRVQQRGASARGAPSGTVRGAVWRTACLTTAALATAAAAAAGLAVEESAECAIVAQSGIAGTKWERTLVILKPDAVQRGLVGELIARIENKGFKLVSLKLMRPTIRDARAHYEDLSARPFFNSLVDYFTSGPVVAMVWEGTNVIRATRTIVGATNPADAAMGTVRGDLALDVGRNLIHASDSPEAAKKEIELWFNKEDVLTYDRANDPWITES